MKAKQGHLSHAAGAIGNEDLPSPPGNQVIDTTEVRRSIVFLHTPSYNLIKSRGMGQIVILLKRYVPAMA